MRNRKKKMKLYIMCVIFFLIIPYGLSLEIAQYYRNIISNDLDPFLKRRTLYKFHLSRASDIEDEGSNNLFQSQFQESGKPAGPAPKLPPHDPDSFRAIDGYRGPFYRKEILGGDVKVLTQTLYRWPIKNWKVTGLLRNETNKNIKINSMTAFLFDTHGNTLGSTTAWIPITQIRQGEPAPFVIEAGIQRDIVHKVDWRIDYTPSSPLNRSFQINLYWQLPFGYRQRRIGYPLDDPPNPPYPYVVFGSLRNVSNKKVNNVRLLGAWQDNQGRIIYVDWFTFLPVSKLGNIQDIISLLPGDAEDYVYQNSDPLIADKLSTAILILWGISQ